MASKDDIYNAIRAADKAGNVEDVKRLAAYLETMDAKPEQPAKVGAEGAIKKQIVDNTPVALGITPAMASGFMRGARDVVDTGADYLSRGYDALTGSKENARVKDMNAKAKEDYTQQYGDNTAASVARVGGNIAATMPATGLLGGAAKLAGATKLGNAIASGGMTTGGEAVGYAAKAGNLLTRAGGGAINGGVSAGLVNPDDAASGAIVGGAAPVVFGAIGAGAKAVGGLFNGGKVDPAKAALAQKLAEQGIDVLPYQLTESKPLKIGASILSDAPIVGGKSTAAKAAQQDQLNAALGQTMGIKANKLDEAAKNQALADITGELDRIWNNNTLKVDAPFVKDITAIRQQVIREMPGDQGRGIVNKLDDFLNKIDGNSLEISGEAANRFQSSLRNAKDDLQPKIRKAVLAAFDRSISREDAPLLAAARNRYGNFKVLEPLMDKSTTGDISAANLLARVASQGNRPDLVDIAKGAKEFMVDRVPQTGGSGRAMAQNLLAGGGLGALATGVGLPAAAGTAAGLMTVGNAAQKRLLSKELARKMIEESLNGGAINQTNGNALQRLLYQSAPQLTVSR